MIFVYNYVDIVEKYIKSIGLFAINNVIIHNDKNNRGFYEDY